MSDRISCPACCRDTTGGEEMMITCRWCEWEFLNQEVMEKEREELAILGVEMDFDDEGVPLYGDYTDDHE